MKILCIGRNYADHIAELSNEKPDEPVVFTKPDTALLRNGEPFYHPEYTQDVHHEVEIVLRVCKEGKYVGQEFAERYYDAVGLGIDFTARDLQSKAKAKGLPWALAKGFNGSAPISEFIDKGELADLSALDFSLRVNGETRQAGNTKLMLFSFAEIIAYISQFITLRKGDLIFTGTPKGVAAVKRGDRLEGFIGERKLLDFEVK